MSNDTTKTLANSGLHALIWQEEDLFVAKCVEVEVISQGKTEAKALKNLDEALDLFFEDTPSRVPGFTNVQVVTL